MNHYFRNRRIYVWYDNNDNFPFLANLNTRMAYWFAKHGDYIRPCTLQDLLRRRNGKLVKL